jgi:hypothetical protein
VIIAIDDSPTTALGIDGVRALLSLPDHRHALTIRRAGPTHQLVVMTRHLVETSLVSLKRLGGNFPTAGFSE